MTLVGHDGPVCALAVLPDGRLVSTSGDTTARVWNITAGGSCDFVLEGHSDYVRAVAVITEGKKVLIVTGSDDGTLRVYDSATGAWMGPTGAAKSGCGRRLVGWCTDAGYRK